MVLSNLYEIGQNARSNKTKTINKWSLVPAALDRMSS